MPRLFDPLVFDRDVFDTRRRVTIFVPPPLTLTDVLQGSHTPIARLEFLDPANPDVVLRSIDAELLTGSVTTDRSADTFASASVEIVNDDGSLALESPASLVWADRPVRISRGAMVGHAPVLVPLITGVVTQPKDGLATGSVTFSVASRFFLAKRNFSGPTTTPAGRLRDSVRLLLELGGLGTSDALYDLDDGGLSVPERTFDVSEEILGSAIKWSFEMACDLWPAATGMSTMRPVVDPATQARKFDFAGGALDVLLTFDKQVNSNRRYNRQVVYGRGPDGYTISAEAKITNPGDPLYWRPDFDLPAAPYTSPAASTFAACLALAERMLRDQSGYEEIFAGSAVPLPIIAARDVVGFPAAGYGDNFLLDRVVMPIKNNAMETQARRTRSVTI